MDKSKKIVWDIISTPDNADFKKYREEHEYTWLTKERELLVIETMATDHIISCINMLERAGQEYTKAYKGLVKELQTRYDVN